MLITDTNNVQRAKKDYASTTVLLDTCIIRVGNGREILYHLYITEGKHV